MTRSHRFQQVLVVADPAAPAGEVDALVTALRALDLSADVSVRTGCRPRDALTSIEDRLVVSAGDAAFSSSVDPGRGTLNVVTNDEAFASGVREQYGDSVTVAVVPQLGRLVGGRTADSTPHYADANIGVCSSNFSFSHPSFYRVTATAGHCGDRAFYSGSNYVGETLSLRFPNPDMQLVWGLYHDDTNRVYVDPCCPSVRTVVGSSTPGVNAYVCIGGARSLSQCGAEVIDTDALFCDAQGCTHHLTQVFRLGSPALAVPGDSGGAVYQRSGSSGALAAGMIIAGGGPVYGGYTEWHHTVSQIEATFGVRLVTSP